MFAYLRKAPLAIHPNLRERDRYTLFLNVKIWGRLIILESTEALYIFYLIFLGTRHHKHLQYDLLAQLASLRGRLLLTLT